MFDVPRAGGVEVVRHPRVPLAALGADVVPVEEVVRSGGEEGTPVTGESMPTAVTRVLVPVVSARGGGLASTIRACVTTCS